MPASEARCAAIAGRRIGLIACAAATWLFAAATWASGAELADAARRGNLAGVRALLDSGVAVDDRAPDGMTALLWASQANDLELARLLLAAGADPDAGNRYGITPLWLAATNRSVQLVDLLLAHGSDASASLPHGETALMAAARAGGTASIHSLLAAGADPNASEASLGETALMWAAAEDHAEAIRALVEGGADPDVRSRPLDLGPMNWAQTGMVSTRLPAGGWTAPMFAARENSQAAAAALVEAGADLDVQDEDGTTALGFAILNFHYDLAAQLLEAGADPNVADDTGMNALYGAVDMVNLGNVIGRPRPVDFEKLEALDLVRLTLAHGANPNAQLEKRIIGRHHGFGDFSLGKGATALMRAAKSFDVESMRLLLEAGADPELETADGANVLFFLAGAQSPAEEGEDDAEEIKREAVQMLVTAGADVNAVGADGETPLHRAAREGNAAVAAMLVDHGAHLDARDTEGLTPLDIVSPTGPAPNEDIAALFARLAGQ